MQALNTDLWSPIGVVGEADGANLGRKAQEASNQARAGCPSRNIPSGFLSDFVEEFPVSYRVK